MYSIFVKKALNRLHQLEVLGSRLVVEYAKKSHEQLVAQNSHRYLLLIRTLNLIRSIYARIAMHCGTKHAFVDFFVSSKN